MLICPNRTVYHACEDYDDDEEEEKEEEETNLQHKRSNIQSRQRKDSCVLFAIGNAAFQYI